MLRITRPSLVAMGALATALPALSQSGLTSRVFLYDGTVAANGTSTWNVAGSSFSASATAGAVNSNAIVSASDTGLTVEVNTLVFVRTYFYVNGSFSGRYFVRGPGGATVALSTTDIELRVGRPFSIVASGFGPMVDSSNVVPSPSVGTVEHRMRLFRNFPAGSGIGPEVFGVDGAFNGATVSATMDDLPTSGAATLRMRRTVVLNRFALGGETYTSSGVLVLTIT